jgi:hypothetical protein
VKRRLLEMSKATADIDRTIFNKNDQRTEDLHLQLSAKYMVYKDLADRVILNPTQMGKPLSFYYVDF